MSAARAALGAWTGRGARRAADRPKRPWRRRPRRRRCCSSSRPRAPQSELRIGHVGPPRDVAAYHRLVTLNAALGGQFSSRLNTTLREKKGLTYGVHTAFDFRRMAGTFRVRDERPGGRHGRSACRDVLAECDAIRAAGTSTRRRAGARQGRAHARLRAALRDRGPARARGHSTRDLRACRTTRSIASCRRSSAVGPADAEAAAQAYLASGAAPSSRGRRRSRRVPRRRRGARISGRRRSLRSSDVKAVRFHEHGGPEVLRYEDAPDPDLRAGWRARPRARVRAQSSRSLAAARARSRQDSDAAHLGRRRRRRDRRGRCSGGGLSARHARDAPAGSELRPLRKLPRRRDNLCANYDVLGLSVRGRLRRARGRAGGERHSAPGRGRLRQRRRVSAVVSDRVAHARHARGTHRARHRARARRRAAASGRPRSRSRRRSARA